MNGESLYFMLDSFVGLVQRLFNRDKIQNTSLTLDNVLNIC